MFKVFKEIAVCSSVLVALLVSSVMVAGCSPSGEVKLEAKDSGRQIEIEKGQSLVITLASNPTTGYRWEVAELEESILRQVGEAEFQPQSDLVGAPGVEILRFETVKAGQTPLKLVYHRPWETDVDPLETFSIQVVVR